MTRRRAGFTLIELAVVVAIISVLIALLLPAVQSAREAARRAQCSNNLLQLGIAVANYESSFRVFPPGTLDATGPILETPDSYQFNWITQILPYMEQKNAYQRLNFNVGIYQTANLTVRGTAMTILLCPSMARGGLSSFGAGSSMNYAATSDYAACHHHIEAPIDVDNKGVFFLNSHLRLDQIDDGLSHTIFLGEKPQFGDELGWASGTGATLRNTGSPINLTKKEPTDLAPFVILPTEDISEHIFDPNAPSNPGGPVVVGGFGSRHPHGANFVFGDGSIRFLRNGINLRIYQQLGHRADGEAIGDDQF